MNQPDCSVASVIFFQVLDWALSWIILWPYDFGTSFLTVDSKSRFSFFINFLAVKHPRARVLDENISRTFPTLFMNFETVSEDTTAHCSSLPTELSSQLGAGHVVTSHDIPVDGKDTSDYMKDHKFQLWRKIWRCDMMKSRFSSCFVDFLNV